MVLSVPFKSSFEYIGQIYIVHLCIKRVIGGFSVYKDRIFAILLVVNVFKFWLDRKEWLRGKVKMRYPIHNDTYKAIKCLIAPTPSYTT